MTAFGRLRPLLSASVAAVLAVPTAAAAQQLTRSESDSAEAAAVRGVLVADVLSRRLLIQPRSGALCLGRLRDHDPVDPPRFLLAEVPRAIAVVPIGRCPRTYSSMVVVTDSLGRPINDRPPGYVDPVQVVLERPVRTESGMVLVLVHVAQGTGTSYYVCVGAGCTDLPLSTVH